MSPLHKFLYFLIAVLVVVMVVILATHDISKVENPHFTKFYNTALDGRLASVYASRETYIRVGASREEYAFYPRSNDSLDDGNYFPRFAEVGDSVRKPARSDTLYLLKNGRTYKYLFSLFKK